MKKELLWRHLTAGMVGCFVLTSAGTAAWAEPAGPNSSPIATASGQAAPSSASSGDDDDAPVVPTEVKFDQVAPKPKPRSIKRETRAKAPLQSKVEAARTVAQATNTTTPTAAPNTAPAASPSPTPEKPATPVSPAPLAAPPAPLAAPPAPAPAPPVEKPSAPPRPAAPEPESNPGQAAPRIVNIEVEGNEHIPTDEVLQVVSTRIGDPLLQPRIYRDMQAIFDLGYFTDVRLDTRVAPGGVRLVFRVLENPVVKHINIVASGVVPAEKLESLMETKVGSILNTRTLHADLQNINKYYNEELGYLLTTHVEDLKFENGNLSIRLKDGMRVKKVVVEGVTVFPVETVEALVKVKPGDLFNQKLVKEDSAAIAKLYEKNDYILDTIVPSVDDETGTLTYKVQEAVLQEFRVEGNVRTTTETILKNMRSKPGHVMQKKRIQKDIERLNSLGFFKKVDVNPEPGTEPGKLILVLDVEEQKTGLATIGLGYAGGGTGAIRPGPTGAVSLSEKNLFGTGKTASLQVQAGVQVRSVGLSYLDPAINQNQDSIGASLFYNDIFGLREPVVNGSVTNFAYIDEESYGETLTYGHPFTDELRGFASLGHQNIKITEDSSSTVLPTGLTQGILNTVGFSAIYDTRNDVFNPHVGTFLNGGITLAGLGGTYSYDKYTFEAREYIPLGQRDTIALRAWYGSIQNGVAPVTEYFYAGGTDTMRGYLQNQFFGTQFLDFNAEFRFPLAKIKFLSGAVFADAGNAWSPGVTPGGLFADAGVGLRIVFPTLGLGVIRVDYAIGKYGGRVSIGIGQTF